MQNLFHVVFESEQLLVVNKPAGLVCHPTKGDVYSSLVSRVRLYLGTGAESHLVNRLDRETSGLVLVAKDRSTAAAVRRLWEERTVRKEYLAIVHGTLAVDRVTVDAPLGPDPSSQVVIKDAVRPGGAPAMTEIETLRRFTRSEGLFSMVRAVPLTGRKHQIRIHLAHIGHPIVGDKIYGGDERLYLDFVSGSLTEEQRRRLILPHHALHAHRLRFDWGGQTFDFSAEPEAWFSQFNSDSLC